MMVRKNKGKEKLLIKLKRELIQVDRLYVVMIENTIKIQLTEWYYNG